MSLDLALGRTRRSYALGALEPGARGYAPSRWVTEAEAEALVAELTKPRGLLRPALPRELAEEKVMSLLRAKKIGIMSGMGLDLGVMVLNKLRGRPADAPLSGPVPQPAPESWSTTERRALKLLEPSTAAHVVDVISWARARGIPARLSTYATVYTPARSARHYEEGRSAIEPGKIGWHHVGRAYHLRGPGGHLSRDEYARVAWYARQRGGDWLGDKTVVTPRGPVEDLAHYEYHPGLDLGPYRRSRLAEVEYRRAQTRAQRYA